MSNPEFQSYNPIHTSEELKGLTQTTLGADIVAIDRKDLGEINSVYHAQAANGQKYVIHVSPKEQA